jgi:hypothetical protein
MQLNPTAQKSEAKSVTPKGEHKGDAAVPIVAKEGAKAPKSIKEVEKVKKAVVVSPSFLNVFTADFQTSTVLKKAVMDSSKCTEGVYGSQKKAALNAGLIVRNGKLNEFKLAVKK